MRYFKMVLGTSAQQIEENSFGLCTNLNEIIIPSSMTIFDNKNTAIRFGTAKNNVTASDKLIID